MTDRGFSDDGTIDDLPWASVFDPAANARALSAIQAEGFRAASRIVNRFVRAVEPHADAPESDADPGSHSAAGDGVHEFERLTRAWWSMAGQFLLQSLPATAKTGGESVSLDVGGPGTPRGVNFDVAIGESTSSEIWLHNRGSDDRGDVRLQASDLLGHDGSVIPAAALRIDTEVVPMPARSSRGVVVTVDVGAEVRPGVYRGTVLASGNPDLWLPVTLTVRLPTT
ncbi:hypothetical protein [Mycobacterium sp.]|uniref:hypothetical protein n=1 Tax=Mycobacterium sp. TaxID=1785 RepID=UPI003D13A024